MYKVIGLLHSRQKNKYVRHSSPTSKHAGAYWKWESTRIVFRKLHYCSIAETIFSFFLNTIQYIWGSIELCDCVNQHPRAGIREIDWKNSAHAFRMNQLKWKKQKNLSRNISWVWWLQAIESKTTNFSLSLRNLRRSVTDIFGFRKGQSIRAYRRLTANSNT